MFLLVSVHVGAHLYKSLKVWVKHFFGYLVYEIFLWPEIWRGSLYIYLLSFPRFWTLSIERFWFLLWSILNGVTQKTSNLHSPLLVLISKLTYYIYRKLKSLIITHCSSVPTIPLCPLFLCDSFVFLCAQFLCPPNSVYKWLTISSLGIWMINYFNSRYMRNNPLLLTCKILITRGSCYNL